MQFTVFRMMNICIQIFIFSVCFFVLSAGIDYIPINISDSLTLHNGDIATFQADDNTFLKFGNMASCVSKPLTYTVNPLNDIEKQVLPIEIALRITERKNNLHLTELANPDDDSYFIVETAENNQIRLRSRNNELYLRCHDPYKSLSNLIKELDSKSDCFRRPYIAIDATKPDKDCLFTVEDATPNEKDDNKIKLKASNGAYLQLFIYSMKYAQSPIKTIEVKYRIIIAESTDPQSATVFTVKITGLDPDYVQSVSNVIFDDENLSFSSKPSIIIRFEPQENTGNSERYFIINDEYTTKKINKWTWEKGIELEAGTKITADLKIPNCPGFGAEVSTVIKEYTKNTNEYQEEEEHTVSWSQHIQIPPYTRVSAEIAATEATVEVPFTAQVNVTSDEGSVIHSYPINGSYQGTRYIGIKINVTEESLNHALVAEQNISQFEQYTPLQVSKLASKIFTCNKIIP